MKNKINKHKVTNISLSRFEEIIKSLPRKPEISFEVSNEHIEKIIFETISIRYEYWCFDLDPRYADDALLMGLDILDKYNILYPQIHKFYSQAQLNKKVTEIKIGE